MQKLLFTSMVLFFGFNATAQSTTVEPSHASCLPIGRLIDLAKINSPDALIAKARIGGAEAEVVAARSLFKPQLSAFGRSGIGDTGITDSGVSNQLGIRASQRIFDFGDAKYARQSARAGLAEQEFQAQYMSNRAVLSTLRTALDYYQAQDQRVLTAQRRDFFREQESAVKSLLEAGGATLTEVANVSSRLAEAESFFEELEFVKSRALTEIESDTANTSQLCEKPMDIDESFPEVKPLFAPGYAKQVARQNSAFLQSLAKRVEGLTAVEKRQKRSRLPTISLVGTGSYASSNRFENFEFRDRLGVDISVPLYGGTIVSSELQATARSNLANAEYVRAAREIEESIDITLQRIASLKQQLTHRQETERQMEIRFQSAIIEKEAGTKTLSDLIEIRLEYEQAGLTRINNEYEIKRQKLNLLEQVGHDF